MSRLPTFEKTYDELPVSVYETNQEVGQAAADEAVATIADAIGKRGRANLILATGNSQLTFLEALRTSPTIDWPRINVFHMDEYVGIDPAHPASFPGFLRRHLLDHVPAGAFYPINSLAPDVEAECRRYAALLQAHPADLCALGIGENGHLAFNDPPFADFADPLLVKIVRLDNRSRMQQVGEGHFAHLDEVPAHAITLTIPALLAARKMLVIVPEARKAEAVACSLLGPISEACPGSILRRTGHAHLFLDRASGAPVLPRADAGETGLGQTHR